MNHSGQARSDADDERAATRLAVGAAPITAAERDFWRRAVHEQRIRLAAGLAADADIHGHELN